MRKIASSGDTHILSFSKYKKEKKQIQKRPKKKQTKAKGIVGCLSDVEGFSFEESPKPFTRGFSEVALLIYVPISSVRSPYPNMCFKSLFLSHETNCD